MEPITFRATLVWRAAKEQDTVTSNPVPPLETDLKAITRECNESLAARAAEKFAAAVLPIYGATARGEPDHIGSAVLLDVHGTKVLIKSYLNWTEPSCQTSGRSSDAAAVLTGCDDWC